MDGYLENGGSLALLDRALRRITGGLVRGWGGQPALLSRQRFSIRRPFAGQKLDRGHALCSRYRSVSSPRHDPSNRHPPFKRPERHGRYFAAGYRHAPNTARQSRSCAANGKNHPRILCGQPGHAGHQWRGQLRNVDGQDPRPMAARHVLGLHDERRRRPYLRRERNLAVQPAREATRPITQWRTEWRRLWKNLLGRSHEPWRLKANFPGQKLAGAIPLANLHPTP